MTERARYDVVILGAGAAGLLCAATAARRGRRVLLLDHNASAGKKILACGGGRANFTNREVAADDYRSRNPRFAASALARFAPGAICALLDRHGVRWVEETGGRLFCCRSSRDLVAALVDEAKEAGAAMRLRADVRGVERGGRFAVETEGGRIEAEALVVATGGLSYAELGASDLGYRIAKRFGLRVEPPRPALVALSWDAADCRRFAPLSGIAVEAEICCNRQRARGPALFTHRGLSGPAILDISFFWSKGEALHLDLLPGEDAAAFLTEARRARPKAELTTILAGRLPKRLAEAWCASQAPSRPMRAFAPRELCAIAAKLSSWEVYPAATAGFAKAEVTAGGVDTDALSSKTMEAKAVPGLFFIGEVVDVTGRLGGFNLHWAWASGHAAGMAV